MKIKLPKAPYVPYKDWTVEYDAPMASFDPSKLSLHLEPEQEEGYMKGEILAERMKGKGLNSNVLKYLLDNPKLIPDEWKGKYVHFFGTVLRDPDGRRCVLFLSWRDGAWDWFAHWLERGWDARNPSAVASKVSRPSKIGTSEIGHSVLCPWCDKSIEISVKKHG